MSKNQKAISEANETARSLGLDYGTYIGYVESGYITHYIKMRFHQAVDDELNPKEVEHSNIIGGSKGKSRADELLG